MTMAFPVVFGDFMQAYNSEDRTTAANTIISDCYVHHNMDYGATAFDAHNVTFQNIIGMYNGNDDEAQPNTGGAFSAEDDRGNPNVKSYNIKFITQQGNSQ